MNPDSLPHCPEFRGFYDDIHVDEKWFELTEAVAAMILARGEPRPYRTCKSKKFVPKIMFLCANPRPRFHPETGECSFDGKWEYGHLFTKLLHKEAVLTDLVEPWSPNLKS